MKTVTFRIATLIFVVSTVISAHAQGTLFEIKDGLDNYALKRIMENNVNTLISSFKMAVIENKKPKLSKDNFTVDAIEGIEEMWKSSAMNFPITELKSRCLNTSTGYQVRGIPVDMLEADKAEERQELTIDFQKDGKISAVSVAIEMHRYDMIMAEKSNEVDYSRRQFIVDFVENFRTAYNKKDMKMLNSVFSDKALIITGKLVKEKPNSDITKMTLNNNRVVYIKQTKMQYLEKLRNIFKNTKYINVKFEDIEVTQHPKYDDIYGVNLKQYWHTSNYQDVGYLFLMIDFRDPKNPIIQVRTWQPDKDDKGNVVTKKEDVFRLGSFRIVR
jgi:hypothetical protein